MRRRRTAEEVARSFREAEHELARGLSISDYLPASFPQTRECQCRTPVISMYAHVASSDRSRVTAGSGWRPWPLRCLRERRACPATA